MATMTTVTALTSRRALAPTVRQGRLSRAGDSDSARSSTIRIRRCRAARAAFRLPGAAIIARASDDVHARGLDAASDGDVPPRTNDAVRDDPVRKLAVALAATAAMAHCDVALAADAAAEVAAASGFWGLAPVVWLKSGWTGFTGLLASPEAKDIYVYTIKTLISWGVPAVTVGIVAFFVIGSSRKSRQGGADKPGGGFSLFGGGRAGEKPSPFVIKRLNDRLDSYAYAFDQAVIGKEAVDAARRRTAFADKYAAVLGKLTAKEREAVTAAKQQWAREDARLRAEMASLSRKIRADAVRAADGKKKNKGDDDNAKSEASEASDAPLLDDFPLLDEVEDAEERALYAEAVAALEADSSGEKSGEKSRDASDADDAPNPILEKLPKLGGGVGGKLAKLAAKRSDAEAKYVTAVAKALPAHKRARLMKLLADPRMSPGWEGDRDPLAVPASRMERRDKPHVFVLQFFGDVRASQASNLREEVTAVLRSAKKSRGDEVVLVLNTGGGTVTGYGLAAAQLTRLKDAGIKLTICVEQVAASGGYMMACTADRLVASPFAVLGSIGVISEIPNVYERLKKEGVEFQTVTAGKFKRTLTPTKKIEKADVEKSKADIEDVLTLFKTFVKQQRPKLVIDEVATGETWFGADALKRDLCDELKTTDDVLLELLAAGREIFSVKYRPPQSGPAALLAGGGGDDDARMGAAAGGGGGGWGALRAAALGVATFAQAAGGSPGSVGLPFSGSYLGGGPGPSFGTGEALAVDGADAAGKVMARGGRYLGEEDYVGGGIFSAVDDEGDVYF